MWPALCPVAWFPTTFRSWGINNEWDGRSTKVLFSVSITHWCNCTWMTLITAKVLTGLKKIVFLFCTTLCAERIAWNKMSVAAHISTKKTSNTRMALWWENRSAFNVLPRLCIFHSVYRSGCIDRNVRYMFSSDLNALLQTICSNYSAQHQRVMRNVNIIPLAPSHYNRFWAASPLYPYAEYWCWYTLNCGGA